jgi:apolipoprotein N-acyltransferase
MTKGSKSPNPMSGYSKYLGAVFQMALVILAFTWLGQFLDAKLQFEFPAFTLILSLVGVGLGLYLFIKKSYSKD